MIQRIRERGGERWFFEQIANGATMTGLAKDLLTSRYELYLWVSKNDRMKLAMKVARMIGASALIEQTLTIADGPGEEDSKVRVARDALRVGQRKYLASVFDPDQFGKKEAVNALKDITALHLDALRAVVADQQRYIENANTRALPDGLRKKEIIVDAQVMEDEND